MKKKFNNNYIYFEKYFIIEFSKLFIYVLYTIKSHFWLLLLKMFNKIMFLFLKS